MQYFVQSSVYVTINYGLKTVTAKYTLPKQCKRRHNRSNKKNTIFFQKKCYNNKKNIIIKPKKIQNIKKIKKYKNLKKIQKSKKKSFFFFKKSENVEE